MLRHACVCTRYRARRNRWKRLMEYTLASAAEAAGVNRSTILRAIKSGKVSARRLDDKSYRIDASELARVYPLQQRAQGLHEALPGSAQDLHEPAQGAVAITEAAELRVEVRLLREQLDRERDTVEDLRRRLDQETDERRTLQRQLMPPSSERPQEAPVATPSMTQPARGFLARLLGR